MADELILKLKVETAEGGKKLEDVKKQTEKISEGGKETAASMGLANTQIGKMWLSFKTGAKQAIASMVTLKGAIAATGIGLLIIAFTSLVSFFKKTERGAQELRVIMATLGAIMGKLSDIMVKVGEALFNAFKNPKQAVEDLWKAIKENLINRGQGLIDFYVGIFKVLREGFEGVAKSLQAAMTLKKDKKEQLKKDAKEAFDAMKQEIKGVGESMVQVATGVDNFVGKAIAGIKNLTGGLKEAAEAGAALERRQNALNVATREAQISNALLRGEIQKFAAIYNDATASTEDRIAAMDKEIAANQQLLDGEIERAREQYNIIAAQNAISESNEADLQRETDAQQKLIDLQNQRENVAIVAAKKRSALLLRAEKEEEAYYKSVEAMIDQEVADFEAAQLAKEQALQDHLSVMRGLQQQYELGLTKTKEEYDKLRLKQQYENDMLGIEQSEATEEQKNEQLLLLHELYLQDVAALDAGYKEEQDQKDVDDNQKKLDDAKALHQAIGQAAIQAAGAAADAIIGLEQQKLNKRKAAELANTNLTEKQKEAINKKYAKEQQKLDIKKAIISGSLAILSALSTQPFIPTGLIAAALAAVVTGIQIATIKKTQYATGGYVTGASHATTGVDINAEGGEYIINKRAMQNPVIAQQSALLNAGVPLTEESNAGITREEAVDLIKELGSIPVVVTQNRIEEANRNVVVREERFTQK